MWPFFLRQIEDMEEEKKNIDELKNIAKEALSGLVRLNSSVDVDIVPWGPVSPWGLYKVTEMGF